MKMNEKQKVYSIFYGLIHTDQSHELQYVEFTAFAIL